MNKSALVVKCYLVEYLLMAVLIRAGEDSLTIRSIIEVSHYASLQHHRFRAALSFSRSCINIHGYSWTNNVITHGIYVNCVAVGTGGPKGLSLIHI